MKAVAQILIALGLFAIAAALFIGISEAKVAVQNQARHTCAQDYRLEYYDETTNTTVIKPIDDLYSTCLTEKGL